jgi:hypothetical protein
MAATTRYAPHKQKRAYSKQRAMTNYKKICGRIMIALELTAALWVTGILSLIALWIILR